MTPADLPVTLTFISVCAAMLMPLSGWIGLYRSKIGVLRGDGGNPVLFKRIRIHGNFVENAPLTALAMAGAEGLGLASTWLWIGFGTFLSGRILHYMLYVDGTWSRHAADHVAGLWMGSLDSVADLVET